MSTRELDVDRFSMNDDQVMAAVKAGSEAAFCVLYHRYSDQAHRLARSVCRDEGRAEEAVQEAFVSIWKIRMSYEAPIGSVAPWVLTVVRYRAIDIARRDGRQSARRTCDDNLHMLAGPARVEEQIVARAQADELRNLLTSLPDSQRQVITLAFYGELTHREIAAHLGVPAGTVKGRMRLGLQRLRGDIGRLAD